MSQRTRDEVTRRASALDTREMLLLCLFAIFDGAKSLQAARVSFRNAFLNKFYKYYPFFEAFTGVQEPSIELMLQKCQGSSIFPPQNFKILVISAAAAKLLPGEIKKLINPELLQTWEKHG